MKLILGGKMKKITFDDDLKDHLKILREKLGIIISNEKMEHVSGSDGCGGICKFTCSYHCSDEPSEEITMIEPN